MSQCWSGGNLQHRASLKQCPETSALSYKKKILLNPKLCYSVEKAATPLNHTRLLSPEDPATLKVSTKKEALGHHPSS